MENQNTHELEKKFVFLPCIGKKVENKNEENPSNSDIKNEFISIKYKSELSYK